MLKKLVRRRQRDDSDTEKRVSVKRRDGKKGRAPLLDSAIVEALHSAILTKRKLSALEICQVFEKYDIDEVGSIDDATFAKCIKKIGIQWKKEQLTIVQECFRLRKNTIDYYAFVDFATNPRDSEKLAALNADIRQSIEHYDKRSGEQPFNVLDELQRLDKKEKLWITCESFQTFLESKKPVDFELTAKQIRILNDRFSFDYSDGKTGVDYVQFAQWLQPSFHFKLKDLQKRLSCLLNESRKRNGLKIKDIFQSMDEDESGFVSRIEFKEALLDLGLPVTDAQIKCLVESFDKDGDGKINYNEFTAMFAEVSENDDSDDKKQAKKTKKPQVKAFIEPVALEAMQKAVHHKQRKNAYDVASIFEKYDTKEQGVITEAKFIKGLSKLGIKLSKEQTSRLITAFRSSKHSSDAIDYYAFVDYLMYLPDTKKLEKILAKVQHKIHAYDKKSGEQPFNLCKSFEKLDTKERGWIAQEAFESFFEQHPDIAFDLSSSELKTLCERFEYQYTSSYKGKTKMVQGIDYEQCAKWLQPSMHMDIKTLHQTVQALIHHAQKAYKLNLIDVFRDIDDDDNGYITRLELKETLRAMGLPLTDTQIKCLMDEYDTNGDDKIEYKEFVQAMASNDSSDNEKKSTKTKSSSTKDAILNSAIIKSISKAVRQDRKISSTELVAHFEKLDKEENGHLELGEFQKGLTKCGIHLKKDQIKAIASCFRKGKKGIDYYDFVDFATNVADTDKLGTIGNRMRAAIAKYDKNSGEQPYNALESLRKGDKKKLLRLKPSTFESYLRSNGVVEFDLNDKEISTVLERFEFIYDDDTKGIDYEQFARWLQPAMHYDLEELHLHVKKLFRKTKRSWKDLFKTMDEDGSGSVSCIEFKEALIDLGMPLTDGQIRCLMDEYDNDGDGKMQYKEFVKALADEDEEDSESSSPASPSFRKKMAAKFTFTRKNKAKAKEKSETESDDPPKTKSKRNTLSIKSFFSPRGKKKAPESSDESDTKSKSTKKVVSSDSSSDEKSKPSKEKAIKKKDQHSSDEEPPSKSKKKLKSKKLATSSSDENEKPKPKKPSKKTSKKQESSTDQSEPRQKRAPKTSKKETPSHKKAASSSESSSTPTPIKPKRTKKPIDDSDDSSRGNKGKKHSRRKAAKSKDSSTSSAKSRSPRKRTSRKPSTRRKRVHYSSQSDAPSKDKAASNAESSSSGMNIADLRKFKDRAKGKVKRKRAIDSSTDSNISDAEYYSKTKQALRTAFDFFDVDCSNSIDIEELGHVLRAVGDEVTVEELNQIMQQVDLDASGQIEFEEFYLLMKERMYSKRVEFRAKSELELRAIFDQMDTDHNGMLDVDEFHYALVVQLKIPLTKDEFYAVLDEADTSNDGQIDIDEFTQFMLLVAEASRQDDTLENLSSTARSAIRKIARGAPLDPEAQLLSLLGVPTNFRPAITAAAIRLKKHTMEYVLSFPPPDTVYNMAQQGNLAAPPSQTLQEKWASVESSEIKQCQAVVSLKFAKGVPSPYDKRERDVVERKVRVCFFDMSDASSTVTAAGCRRSDGQIIGNIHEIPVAWSKKEEDVWKFSKASTNCDDYKFIMRTNMPMDDLFLLIEFIVVLKSISAHEMRQVTVKTKYKVPPPSYAQQGVEMTCCWAKIPVTQLISKTGLDVVRFDVPLFGGTFLNPVELDEDEILRRRSGWRALAKALKQYTPPQLQIKSLQIPKLTLQDKLGIAELPSTIVAPYSSVPLIQDYMALMKSVISTLDNPSHVYTCEPALKLFPRILDNSEVYEVFRAAFTEEMRTSFKSPVDRQNKFKDLVLRMWPAFVAPKSRIEMVDEAKEEEREYESKLEQAKRLSSMAKGKFSLQDVKEPSTPFHVREVSFERLL